MSTGQALALSFLRMSSMAASKFAPTRSILLMNAMRGTLYLLAWRQTVSDCGCTPATRVEHGDGAVEHAKRTLHFGGEVHVAGSVDDVHAHLDALRKA